MKLNKNREIKCVPKYLSIINLYLTNGIQISLVE